MARLCSCYEFTKYYHCKVQTGPFVLNLYDLFNYRINTEIDLLLDLHETISARSYNAVLSTVVEREVLKQHVAEPQGRQSRAESERLKLRRRSQHAR